MNSDVRVRLGEQRVDPLGSFHDEQQWTVVLAETGGQTPTGGRIVRVARYLDGDSFLVTYGDGVADIDIGRLVAFHRSHGKLATVTGVRPPAMRFGELRVKDGFVTEFREKPHLEEGWVNGGFFVFEREALRYMSEDEPLERRPLEALARDGQLAVYQHEGYWQAMDTLRDKRSLEEEWATGKAPWKVW